MMAAEKGNVGIVRKLIQHGASVNLTNKVNESQFLLVYIRIWKTANSDWLRNCMSTKLMRFMSSQVLEL